MELRFWGERENEQINIKMSNGSKCYSKNKGDMTGSDTRPAQIGWPAKSSLRM